MLPYNIILRSEEPYVANNAATPQIMSVSIEKQKESQWTCFALQEMTGCERESCLCESEDAYRVLHKLGVLRVEGNRNGVSVMQKKFSIYVFCFMRNDFVYEYSVSVSPKMRVYVPLACRWMRVPLLSDFSSVFCIF